ncbi:MAG: hypothetical protein KIT22_14215, partial [Verrucomicrobiae bacterium]|nr:hypothetical protein [Verrucomicrobiae bacterium]
VGYWRLQEASGSVATDSSPRRLNGTVYQDGQVATTPAWVRGHTPAGLLPRYQVLAENNDPSLGGQPVTLHVIQVEGGPYTGSLVTILPDNVLDQRVTLRHNADFAGDPQDLEFEWYYHPAIGGAVPDLPDPSNPLTAGWIPFPVSGAGYNDITIGDANLSSLITLSDNWFIMRYRGYDLDGNTNWSSWIGDPASTTVPRPMLVEGWIKRVLSGINLFDQRNTDFQNFPVNTLVSSLAQAGPRYEGDIALNPSALDAPGLIQIYQTILNRGENLSVNGTPPVDYDPANQALLLAAGNIADLYMLLGNEAFADAADPTIGLNPPLPDVGSLSASMFAFENQVSSLLEEELGLLRGRDDTSAGVGAAPVYNRLFWNFTGADGEVAYVATYNMSDYNADGSINAQDAAILYPQGHGDAWGHYLTALTTYYGLLQNTNFTWTPQTEDVVLGGTSIEVGYLHERKFAAAAAARAKTGGEILERTYRWDYGAPDAAWTGFKDDDAQRAWGVTEWGWRAGSGAYFDWLAGNAILPANDPQHTGIEKIDRTTVPELAQISSAADQIQAVLDAADRGYNPLGIPPDAVMFDLNPDAMGGDFTAKTHFEQVYERALAAVQNAVDTFEQASELTSSLRAQADSESNFGSAVELQELAYRNQLISLFGYPYGGDIGAGATYPPGYVGPDLYHWQYVDTTDVTASNNPRGTNFTALYQPFQDAADQWGFLFADDVMNALDARQEDTLTVNYPVSLDGYLFTPPATWGRRRAEGALQTSLRSVVQAEAGLRQALIAYNAQVTLIAQSLEHLEARYQYHADQHQKYEDRNKAQAVLATASAAAKAAELLAESAVKTVERVKTGLIAVEPTVAGLAFDATSPIRGLLQMGSIVPETTGDGFKHAAEYVQMAIEWAQTMADGYFELDLALLEANFEARETIADVQTQVRAEAGLRVSLFQQAQALIQALQTLETTFAQAQQALEERLIYRQLTAGSLAETRYGDLAFRIFRNDALEQYDTQFELAARYVYLAAKAFDYEVNLDSTG